MDITWTTLTLDCGDGEEVAAFWSGLLGWDIVARDGAGWLQLRDPGGGVGLNIQADADYERPVWPEQPGHQSKMMHTEVLVDDLEAAVGRVVDIGGPRHSTSRQTAINVACGSCWTLGTPSASFVHGEGKRTTGG